jgi:hypothetical protein
MFIFKTEICGSVSTEFIIGFLETRKSLMIYTMQSVPYLLEHVYARVLYLSVSECRAKNFNLYLVSVL